MVKREWTKEQKEDIVNSFNDGVKFKELQDRYKTHYNSIKKILDEYGVNTNSRRRWTESKKEAIIYKFTQENKTIEDLKKEYKTHHREIVKILTEAGIDTSYYSGRIVNRNIKKDFFETIDTEEKAYILGLIMADGCVRPKAGNLYFTLEMIDLDIIQKVQKAINSNSTITVSNRNRAYIKNEKPTYTFSVFSDEFCKHMLKYGIIHNKTKETDWLTQDIPVELRRHYLRGLFDGDGSIGCYNNRHCISLINNHPSFLESVTTWIYELSEIKKPKVSKTSTSHRVIYTGKNALKLMDLLYRENSISLDRKQKLVDQAVQDIV